MGNPNGIFRDVICEEEAVMVIYLCRRCRQIIGRYEGNWDEPILGLSKLRPEWQKELMEGTNTDWVQVNILCDDCLPIPFDEGLWYN